MNTPTRSLRPPRRAGLLAALCALTTGAAGLGLAASATTAVPAASAVPAATARVTFAPGTADPDYATRLALHGTGFQPIKGGFGGIYVLFGTVTGAWQPSRGGVSGTDYVYVQDSETKHNHGYQKFVSFQDGGTLYAANGGIIHPDGSWATTLTVPGATFPARGRDGGVRRVDCRKQTCGIITIGAHGVVDPQNETFTPVSFAVPGAVHSGAATATAPSGPGSGTAAPSSAVLAAGTGAGTAAASPARPAISPAADQAASSSIGSAWWIGLAVAAAVVGLAVWLLLARRGRAPGQQGGAAGGGGRP